VLRFHNPDGVSAPASSRSLGVEVAPNARWLLVGCQFGIRPDGTTPDDLLEQHRVAWENVQAVLASAEMAIEDIAYITAYLVGEVGIVPFRRVRDTIIGNHRPAEAVVIVQSLISPAWKVGIDVVAAKA